MRRPRLTGKSGLEAARCFEEGVDRCREEWTISIEDITPTVETIRRRLEAAEKSAAPQSRRSPLNGATKSAPVTDTPPTSPIQA
jgi:hypothetical protein